MAFPIFPNEEQIMDLLMGEMPDGVFATDRADNIDTNKRTNTSSEIRTHARMIAALYANLQDIFEDEFISTLNADGLPPWNKQLFSQAIDSSLPFAVQQQNLINKIRANGGISFAAINAVIHTILDPLGLTFDLVTWCGMNGGAWILDVSELDVDTFLSFEDPLMGARRDMTPLDCNLNYAAAGITAQDLVNIQRTAYTYEVRIHGTASTQTLSQLDQTLTQLEPARSAHVISNNFPAPMDGDIIDLGTFTSDTLIDLIDCGHFINPYPVYTILDMGSFV